MLWSLSSIGQRSLPAKPVEGEQVLSVHFDPDGKAHIDVRRVDRPFASPLPYARPQDTD